METKLGSGRGSGESGEEGPLQTVARGLDVLLSYSDRRTDWGVYELAEHFGYSKSTAQRVLAALASRGFLSADPYTRRYSLGPAVWRLSALWERTGGLARLAEASLIGLVDRTGCNSSLSVPDGCFVRCVAAVIGPEGLLRPRDLVGELYPAHAGATARGYFAFIDQAEQLIALHGLPLGRYTESTEVDIDRLMRLYEEAAGQGYAITFGEWDGQSWAVAAPVRIGSRVVGSVSVSGRRDQMTPEQAEEHIGPVVDAARELGRLLAGGAPVPQRNWRRGKSVKHPVRSGREG